MISEHLEESYQFFPCRLQRAWVYISECAGGQNVVFRIGYWDKNFSIIVRHWVQEICEIKFDIRTLRGKLWFYPIFFRVDFRGRGRIRRSLPMMILEWIFFWSCLTLNRNNYLKKIIKIKLYELIHWNIKYDVIIKYNRLYLYIIWFWK